LRHCARCGLDVSVQYGANQPEYDLLGVRGGKILKISVKGSKDGGWGLAQSHVKETDYHRAADIWPRRQKRGTVLCFVQFKDVLIVQFPRVCLATLCKWHGVLRKRPRVAAIQSFMNSTPGVRVPSQRVRAIAFPTIGNVRRLASSNFLRRMLFENRFPTSKLAL
jgi:hypothetical protein